MKMLLKLCVAVLLLALAQTVSAQVPPSIKLAEPSRGLTVDSSFEAEHLALLKWERGYLLGYDIDRSIAMAVDRSGKAVLRAHISPQQASHVLLRDISASPGGTFAVAFSGIGPSGGFAGFIAWLDHTGSTAQLVQVASGEPFLVCFADDGTLWAAVQMYTENLAEAAAYDMLRHYDASGKFIGSALARRVFPAGPFPGDPGSLTASHDRIGFLASASRTWVELTYSGKDLGHWTLPGPPAKLSKALLSQSNEVYIGQQERIDRTTEVVKSYLFDKPSNSFQELDSSAVNGGRPARLVGVDGDELVYVASYGPRLLKWSTYTRSSGSRLK